MHPLRRLLRAFEWRAHGAAVDPADFKSLRRDVAAARRTTAELLTQVTALRRQAALFDALASAEADSPARMQVLDRLLDLQHVSRHVEQAITAAALVQAPVPHLVIDGFFPADVFAAIADAIPFSLFFDDRGERAHELRIPPPLAAVPVLATWQFVTAVISGAVRPALAARVAPPLGHAATVELTHGRIVRIDPGQQQPVVRQGPRDVAMVAVYLSSNKAEGPAGSVMSLPGEPAHVIPFVINRAVCVLASGGHEYGLIAKDAPEGAHRCIYEVRLALTSGRGD